MPTRQPETPSDDEALELLAALPQDEQDELAMLAQHGIDLSALAEPSGDKETGDGQEGAQGGQEGADSDDDARVEDLLAEAGEVRTYVARYAILIGGRLLQRGETFPATASHPRVLAGQAELTKDQGPTEEQQAALDALP